MEFNSAEFAWKDIEVSVMGRVVGRILEISYTSEVDKKHIYGRGNRPVGVQIGNYKYAAQIKVGQSELEAMIQKAQSLKPGATPLDISFNINVAYRQGTSLVRDRVEGFTLTKMPKEMKQGDTDMEVTMPGLAMDIKYNL